MTTVPRTTSCAVTILRALLFTPLLLAATARAQPCPNRLAGGSFPTGTATVCLAFSGFPNTDTVHEAGPPASQPCHWKILAVRCRSGGEVTADPAPC